VVSGKNKIQENKHTPYHIPPTTVINFSKYSSIKIGPRVEVNLITKLEDYDPKDFIIGGANNILVSPNPPSLSMLSKEHFEYIKQVDDLLFIGASTKGVKFYNYCKKNDIGGFEILQKIPGLMGGIVKMNAGLKEYEIFENLVQIKTNNGILKKENIEFDYRYTNIEGMIFEAVFKVTKPFDKTQDDYIKSLRFNQPKTPSAGSCFKNPKNDYAGRLIQEVGLKGKRIGNMSFSEVHANFLVNLGGGTYEEAIELINLAKQKVKEQFNINLQEEIIII
jgi:UDP-N-acetylmuramate dehydrogenase